MSRISFQNEQPSELDVFPGGSHDKVATAMCDYIADENNPRVLGLDGEFGSGKSSILTMLQQKLVKVDQRYKVWFFDCEQNYQGSIKSNFIELFTEELLEKVGANGKVRESLQDSRDRALGRQFTYTKNTISRVSSWALMLVVALFFSTSSFKELFALSKLEDPKFAWVVVHIFSFVSPLLVLLLAHWRLKGTKVGDQPWSIYHLFKGGSDDTITEKIKVAKEVTPLDLKRTLDDDLKLIGDLHYVVILDNLDRLPKDSLRAVWSDLEIFTWVAADNNLTIIVPFCSNKVAKYLAPENERSYDSRDFIAKKFPVVFRAPPIITAGWKDGFYQLWQNTFPEGSKDIAEKCALLLQRHSPMRSKLVTPRLQKRFINDIATTSLTLGSDIDIVCVAAHLLLCKYEDIPLEEVIRKEGVSGSYKAENPKVVEDLIATRRLLGRHVGSGLEDGWQIQFLQIHFLTSSKIAMAELIDEPLALAVTEVNGERFAELVSTFGFDDAYKRLITADVYKADLIQTLAEASKALPEAEFTRILSLLNFEKKIFQGDLPKDDEAFFAALKVCRLAGLSTDGLDVVKKELAKTVRQEINDTVDVETIGLKRSRLMDYDRLIDAVGESPFTIEVNNSLYFAYVFTGCADLKVFNRSNFKFTQTGLKSVQQLIMAINDPTKLISISESQREALLEVLNGSVKNGQDPRVSMTDAEISGLSSSLISYPNNEAILAGLALVGKLPEGIVNQICNMSFDGMTADQRAAVASILMNAERFTELAKVEDLDSVVKTSRFKLYFRGLPYSDALTSYQHPVVGSVISQVLALGIQQNLILRLDLEHFGEKFTEVANAVAPYGVDAQSLFNWLSDWQQHFKTELEFIERLDFALVGSIVLSPAEKFKDFKMRVIEFYGDDARSATDWEPILLGGSENHRLFINWALKEHGFRLGSSYRACALEIVKNIVLRQLGEAARESALQSLHTLIGASDQAQKNLLGAELRNLVYVESGAAEPAVWVLKEFGDIIVDVQPANTAEVGRLMGIFEYLTANSEDTTQVLAYLEGRAKQIASFDYSEQLRDAMAVAVAKLKNTAPKLYQAFAKKSTFKNLLKDILSSERKMEQAPAKGRKEVQGTTEGDDESSEVKDPA